MMKIKGKRFVASIEPIGLLNGSAIAPVTMKQQAYELIKDAILYRRLQALPILRMRCAAN